MIELYKQCLQNGIDISYQGKIFLGKYNHNGMVITRSGYQVHMEGHKPFSKIYKDLNEAVIKFDELRKIC